MAAPLVSPVSENNDTASVFVNAVETGHPCILVESVPADAGPGAARPR